MHLQYGRRDTLEITGIPTSVEDGALEDVAVAQWLRASNIFRQ